MGVPRPFRFSSQERRARSAKEWRERARTIESMGYAALYVPDHFGDQLGPIAALMAAADATTRLRIGPLVLDHDYRHPVVVAKEAATFDLREGRVGRAVAHTGLAAATDQKLAWIKEAAGERFSQIELGVWILLANVTDERDAMASTLAPSMGFEPADVLAMPHFLIGSV